jgi:F0F1-type ATP synthase assembly protein I
VSPEGKMSGKTTGPSGGDLASAGLQFAAAIVVFMFLGLWLDRTLGTSPWLLIVCVFLGAGGGFYSIYRRLMAAQRRSDAERSGSGGGGAGAGSAPP